MTKIKKIFVVLLTVAMLCMSLGTVAACKESDWDNESTRLVMSIGELDGVFNPFFSSSATDGSIVSMTQVGMLSSDKEGNVAFGEDEPCVVLDYEESTNKPSDDKETWRTTYKFVLKNNLKFSNGSPLTMKDVLFNLYVYLDPAYTGSSTVYSTDIVGLAEYRTQQADESAQEGFNVQFSNEATERIYRLYNEIQKLYDQKVLTGVVTDAQMTKALTDSVDYYKTLGNDYSDFFTLVDDYNRAKVLFREELESDYNNAGAPEDITFDNGRIKLTTATEAFFYNEGYITWNDKDKKLEYSISEDLAKNSSKEEAINLIYGQYFETQTESNNAGIVVTAWNTSTKLQEEFTAKAMKDYFDEQGVTYKNVSGITFPNRTEGSSVTVHGKTYGKPTYDSEGNVIDGNEVLQIEIKGVDPKAIWNFAFTVAPMYYYSSPEQISAFNYTDHFGVDYGNIDFMNNYVKASSKIGLPVGAGPYKATTAQGDSANVTPDTFRANNVIHYERNEYFMLGSAKIKYVNYQVVDAKMMLTSLKNGDVHFVEPNCKQESIDEVEGMGEGYAYKTVMTNGYGYIGINAEKVPSHQIRQAIMHAINTQDCLDYYGNYAYRINRSMTRASWAYPEETDDEGQYYEFDPDGTKYIDDLVSDAGYVPSGSGAYTNLATGDKLEYTFTIAGDSEDHPAFNAMFHAAEILNEHGFKVTVKKDINALKKLNTGDLTVWAAAWGSGVDPDMYQVYHIDSQAGATANWGYRAIRLNAGGTYNYEKDLVERLSQQIDAARETLDQDERKEIYAECLDLVMELAVELPTYQRSDMFAYNTNVIDESSLTPENELTPFNGLLNRLWEVSFVGND